MTHGDWASVISIIVGFGIILYVVLFMIFPEAPQEGAGIGCVGGSPAVLKCWSAGHLVTETDIRVAGALWYTPDCSTAIRPVLEDGDMTCLLYVDVEVEEVNR